MPIPHEFRRACADNALRCYGTAHIFDKRAKSLRWKLRWILFLGIAAPAALGGVVGTIGAGSKYVPVALTVAGALGTVQLVLSIWSLAARWDDDFSYFLESKSANYRLSEDFIRLSETQTLDEKEYEIQMKVIEAEG